MRCEPARCLDSRETPQGEEDEPWSDGQTEGHFSKSRTLKRQMYDRAGLDLLRARLIPGRLTDLQEK